MVIELPAQIGEISAEPHLDNEIAAYLAFHGKHEEPASPSQVFLPVNYQELFSSWNRYPNAVPYAGGTELIRSQGKRVPVLPRNILCLEKIDELKRITRTERYLEIGAMVRLNEILALGKIVPDILVKTLEGIAGPQVRSLATIGGSLCTQLYRLDTTAPMTGLDAHYELRTASSVRWTSASRFSGLPGRLTLSPQELLTRIRIPLDQWNYSVYRKFNSLGSDKSGKVIVLILKNQKNILTDLRIVYSGGTVLQSREAEAALIGKQLPLERRQAQVFFDKWKQYLASMTKIVMNLDRHMEKFILDLYAAQIMAFIEHTILEITE